MPQSNLPPKDRQRAFLAGGCIVLFTFIFYLPVLKAGFIWDDDSMLTGNPFVKLGSGLYYIWFTTQPTDYWPLTYSSLWLEWRLWGMNATGYHITNIFLHAGSAVLFWRVLLRLKIPGAWLAAIVFAVHPVNVESVAWITERKNTLSLLLAMLSVLWFLKAESTTTATAKSAVIGGSSRFTFHVSRPYWLSLTAFVLSLLAKTSSVTLPCVLLLLLWWRNRRLTRDDILRTAPFFAAALVLGLVTVWFQTHRAIAGDVVRTDNFVGRLLGAGWATCFYLYKALLPVNLSFVYPRWEISARSFVAWLPLVALVVVAGFCLRFRERWGRSCLAGLGVFFLMLLPILGFVDVYFHRYSLVADHWQYFALTGVVGLVVSGAATSLDRWKARAKNQGAWQWCGRLSGGLLVTILGVLTWRQTLIYTNHETLWRDTLAKNPGSWLALNNLGLLLTEKGNFAEAKKLQFQSLTLKPDQIEAHNNLGEVFLAEGQTEQAKAHYLEALKINPGFAMGHYNLGNVFDREGKPEEAMTAFRRALELNPFYPDAHNNVGCLLVAQGKLDEAVAHFSQAVRYRPDFTDAFSNLGSTLTEQGRAAEAVPYLLTAIRLKPDFADAHFNLGNAYMSLGKKGEAFAEYRVALSFNPNHGPAHFKIGNLMLADGMLDLAEREFQTALTLDPRSADARLQLAATLIRRHRLAEGIEQYREVLRLKPDSITALNNLGWIYATRADAKYRDGKQALEMAERAVALTHTNDPGTLDTLAAAHAEAGDWSQAMLTITKAEKLAGAAQSQGLLQQLNARKRLYETGQPFRE